MDQTLFEAAHTGNITKLKSLLKQDPLLLDQISSSSSENPLHVSVFSNKLIFTKKILHLKPSLAMELNLQGFSPLHIASSLGRLDIVKELLNVGNSKDLCLLKGKDDLIPLHCAAQRGRCEVIKNLVLSCPESLKEVTRSCSETALHLAVKNNQVEATQVLLKEIKKYDMVLEVVNLVNQEGNTILHLAILEKQIQIVEMLIGKQEMIKGVDPNVENIHGLTPNAILDQLLETQRSNASEMFKLVKIFQQFEAVNRKKEKSSAKTQRSSGLSVIEAKRYPKLWKNLSLEIEEFSDQQREALQVVAVLIATLTFQSIIQPPGLFITEDNNSSQNTTLTNNGGSLVNTTAKPGRAIMANDIGLFSMFAVFNAIGFLASISMISLLSKNFSLKNWKRLCIISMMATYVLAIFYISPTQKPYMWIVTAFSAFFVLYDLLQFIKSLINLLKNIDQEENEASD